MADVVDHDLSWSVCFADPGGDLLEQTTYDIEYVTRRLGKRCEFQVLATMLTPATTSASPIALLTENGRSDSPSAPI